MTVFGKCCYSVVLSGGIALFECGLVTQSVSCISCNVSKPSTRYRVFRHIINIIIYIIPLLPVPYLHVYSITFPFVVRTVYNHGGMHVC